ncbi:nucleoside hydrolase [Pectobacterium sp. B1J-3]|uniref:nucleoside hydrolase n=1 Tax=Pectobacterium sp. B1J-3 TaxID=3385371 RepID=UPI003905ECC4
MIDVIYDTDPGVDDAVALHFAHKCADINLVGITTIFGNNTLDVTTRNALFLKDKFGLSCPVVQGCAEPLLIAANAPSVFAHGNDGLGDCFDITPQSKPEEYHAAQFIIDTVLARPHQITIIAVGPLTNLALACKLRPDIASLIKQVVIMGGSTFRNGHYGNKSPVAEANIHRDPHAAHIVFNSHLPLTMVGLDVTHEVLLDNTRLSRLETDGGESGKIMFQITRHYVRYAKERYQLDGMRPHDLQAFMYAIHPEYYQTLPGNTQVVTEGIAIGQTIHYFGEHNNQKNASISEVCIAVDAEKVSQCYFDTVLR